MNRVPILAQGMMLNLGGGGERIPGWTSIDRHPYSEDQIVWDLENGIPLPDNWCAVLRANHFVEHISNPIALMNEAYRVLMPDGTFEITVPSTPGWGAWQDPTHKSFWNRSSFDYYRQPIPAYGIECSFEIVSLEEVGDVIASAVVAVLRAKK